MLGAFLSLLVALGGVGIGRALLARGREGLDPALDFGLSGLVGLGALGTATFFLGLIPGGFDAGVWGVALFALVGFLCLALRRGPAHSRPRLSPAALAPLVPVLFGFVSVLAPSTADDWDSLAYHLAVPKLWLAAGHIFSVPSLHQSNFPDVIDDLFVWGLRWGGESGAKAFSLAFFIFGIFAVFGLARERYGERAGWWAAVAFATVPSLMWESGTAYVDLGHGVFAGLGMAFAALFVRGGPGSERRLVPAAFMLGSAAASKYTGLETLGVVWLGSVAFAYVRKRDRPPVSPPSFFRGAALMAVGALAIASPWYLKNIVLVHNPVYPFLYERLGGANWDQRRADIYRREQQSFGVGQTSTGGHDPRQIGAAVLGLAYQPGRYVNPREDIGLGTPTGAVGVSILLGLLLWPIFGLRGRRFEAFLVASSGLTLLIWFFLSQQSRYLTTLAPPGAVLLGGAIELLPLGAIAAAAAVLQGGYSIWLLQSTRFVTQMQVLLGRTPVELYRSRSIPFYSISQQINQAVPATGKVALYDEVFGYLLDVPYMWANPGHSTIIPYDSMKNGDDFASDLKNLGFTHVYVNLAPTVESPAFTQQWMRAMGLAGPVVPFPPDQMKSLMDNFETRWKPLLAEAVASGRLQPLAQGRTGILFTIL